MNVNIDDKFLLGLISGGFTKECAKARRRFHTTGFLIKVDMCVKFLEGFLEHHVFEFASHNKIQTKKILQKIATEVQVLPNENYSIIENDVEDIMSNWKSYVKELSK